jgi:hypothetical protein
MKNKSPKRCIFLREKYGNWEIMETYSVTFHDFLISALLESKKCGKMTEKYSLPNYFSWHISELCRESFCIFWRQRSLFVFVLLFCHHRPTCRRRAATSYFCNTVEIFSHHPRPAVPDSRIRSPRHSGAEFLRGGRTHDHAPV